MNPVYVLIPIFLVLLGIIFTTNELNLNKYYYESFSKMKGSHSIRKSD